MASDTSCRAGDVQVALQRAKRKISSLEQMLSPRETCSESPEETNVSTCLRTTKELRDSLVDMYSANPRVNVELQQRLPSPARQQLNTTQQSSNSDRSGTSLDHNERPQHVQETSSAFSLLSHKRSFSPLSSKPSGRTGHMEVALSPSRGLSLCADNCGDHYEGNGGSRGPGSPTLRRPTITADNSFLQETNISRPQSLDQDKNILFLLKELDVLRQHNKKLQEQLVQKEKELQRREIEEELKEELKEAQSWEKPAAVLNEVLAAQKDRDQALMSRILLANEERDEAVLRARRLQQTDTEDMDLEETDLEVHQLLRRVCDSDSVQEVHQFGSVLVQHLRLAQQRRDDITAQEMKAIMAERDGCMLRCKRLEQDLIQEREQRATKEELLRLQREGDGALDDRQRLGAELQAHQTSHGSQHLFTPHCSCPGDGVSSMTLLAPPNQTPPLEEQLQEAQPLQASPIMVQLQQLSREKQSMEVELQRCLEAEREASERVRRLERLVEVLRKKVGTGSLRAVI